MFSSDFRINLGRSPLIVAWHGRQGLLRQKGPLSNHAPRTTGVRYRTSGLFKEDSRRYMAPMVPIATYALSCFPLVQRTTCLSC
ncbi:hypothetical protein CC2G_007280 [Coprinopsis cinerea AmutBmut pab1-1]|nr:hypothetical protein CC2G_007280 [Coprinopsis cinerea AmutBmut pab1-1]